MSVSAGCMATMNNHRRRNIMPPAIRRFKEDLTIAAPVSMAQLALFEAHGGLAGFGVSRTLAFAA
jgi:hypothetical protein